MPLQKVPDLECGEKPFVTIIEVAPSCDGRTLILDQPPISNIISFKDNGDPDMAINWSPRTKWSIIFALGFMTLVTSFASTMFSPSINQVLNEFHSHTEYLGSFVVSIYVLGWAAGPLLIGPLSELYGRKILYHVTNVLGLIFTVGCALAPNIASLLACRLLAGMAGSAVLALGSGTIADLFAQEERGVAMSIWSAMSLIGPIIGPVTGGFLGELLGWRWMFWIISIGLFLATLSHLFLMRETYPPVILRQKTNHLRKLTKNPHLTSSMDNGLSTRQLFSRTIIRPITMLAFCPIVFFASIFIAYVYGLLYLLFTTMPHVFREQYGFNEGIIGLTYLGIGLGMIIGVTIFGFTSDRYIRKKTVQNGGKVCLEDRLVLMIPGVFFIPASFFIYGWTAERNFHWIFPILATSLLGLGLNTTFMAVQTYIVDSYPLYAASAMAASTALRSLGGALLPLAGPPMYSKLGLGWGNSLLGMLALMLAPIPFLFMKYGEGLRKGGRFQGDS